MDAEFAAAIPSIRDAAAVARLRRGRNAGDRGPRGRGVSASDAGERASEATERRRARNNRRLAGATAALALAMIGATYAPAPVYAALCRAPGDAGTPHIG